MLVFFSQMRSGEDDTSTHGANVARSDLEGVRLSGMGRLPGAGTYPWMLGPSLGVLLEGNYGWEVSPTPALGVLVVRC